MAKALSADLRSRVGSAVVSGETVRSAAARFGVSVASAVRLGQKQRAGVSLEPKRRGKPPVSVLVGGVADWVRARLATKRDLTTRALAAELQERGTSVSHDTVWRFIRREGLTFKKNTGGIGTGQACGEAVPLAVEVLPGPH